MRAGSFGSLANLPSGSQPFFTVEYILFPGRLPYEACRAVEAHLSAAQMDSVSHPASAAQGCRKRQTSSFSPTRAHSSSCFVPPFLNLTFYTWVKNLRASLFISSPSLATSQRLVLHRASTTLRVQHSCAPPPHLVTRCHKAPRE